MSGCLGGGCGRSALLPPTHTTVQHFTTAPHHCHTHCAIDSRVMRTCMWLDPGPAGLPCSPPSNPSPLWCSLDMPPPTRTASHSMRSPASFLPLCSLHTTKPRPSSAPPQAEWPGQPRLSPPGPRAARCPAAPPAPPTACVTHNCTHETHTHAPETPIPPPASLRTWSTRSTLPSSPASRVSAGTLAPTATSTTSPGTRSPAGTSCSTPLRRTVALSACGCAGVGLGLEVREWDWEWEWGGGHGRCGVEVVQWCTHAWRSGVVVSHA